MMKKILENPLKYLKSKYYDNYFDYKGRLRFFPNFLEEDTIKFIANNLIIVKMMLQFNDFLIKLLCINPNHRANVKTLLNDNWLNN